MSNPESTPAPIDWDDVAGWLRTLDSPYYNRLVDAIHAAEDEDNQQSILETIRERLSEHPRGTEAVSVQFLTTNYDDGYYLYDDGTVTFADGSTELVEFAFISETFTEEYGRCNVDAGLTVDLRTGEMELDDYAAIRLAITSKENQS